MNERELVYRYLDGEVTELEAARARRLLARRGDLRRELEAAHAVRRALGEWSAEVARRGAPPVESTVARALDRRHPARSWAWLGVAAAGLVWLLPSAEVPAPVSPSASARSVPNAEPAAIERLDAGEVAAEVFVVPASQGVTPVVWIQDDASPESG